MFEERQPRSGVFDGGGEGVSADASGSGGAAESEFRQPGEVVGYPGRLGAVVDKGAGPLRRIEHSGWEAVMNRVVDVCAGSPAAVFGTMEGHDEVSVEDGYSIRGEIAALQRSWCGNGWGEMARYAHVTWSGFGPVRSSPREATMAVQEWWCLHSCGHNLGGGGGYGGQHLGYETFHGVFAVDVPADEVVLLWDSVAVRDGELLGLVQNRSAALFAREVTVTLGEHRWVFPLTVQPGEVAPFVLGAGTVSALPERSEVEVTAAMSPLPDLNRSFRNALFPFTALHTSSWDVPWVSHYFADLDFPSNVAPMDLPLGPGDRVRQWFTEWKLEQPNSHPGLAAVEDPVIEDLRAYLTFFDVNTRRVIAVHRLTPLNTRTEQLEPLSRLPVVEDDGTPVVLYDGTLLYGFYLEFKWLADSEHDALETKTVMHVGGAGPWTRTGEAGS